MNPEKLIDCLSEIDEQFIQEAAPRSCRPVNKWWGLAAAVLVIVAAACISPLVLEDPANIPSAPQKPDSSASIEVGDAPPHIYYQGSIYVCRGPAIDVDALPDEAELLGETHYAGDIVPDGADDLDSNIDGDGGYVFMDPSNESLLYFRWKNWDAAVENRPEKILLYYRELLDGEVPPAQANADYPYYNRLNSMVRAADVIMEGMVIGEDADMVTVKVSMVYSGNVVVEEELQVEVPEGCDVFHTSSEDNYLFFLCGAPDAPFSLITPTQGAFPIEQRFLIVPNDYAPLFPGFASVAPPYTHKSFAMNAVRTHLQTLVEQGQYPLALIDEIIAGITPYMEEYGIFSLEANESTNQLDIVLEHNTGEARNAVADLIYEQFRADGFFHFMDRRDLDEEIGH